MRSDENLLEGLQQYVKRTFKRSSSKKPSLKDIDILKSVWFKSLNDKVKEVVVEAIERVKEGRYPQLHQTNDSKTLL